MREVFGSKGIVLTYDIVQYLSSMVSEAFATTVGDSKLPVLDLATQYRNFSGMVQKRVNEMSAELGIEFTEVLIESISLPEEVEKLIDEQSGIGMLARICKLLCNIKRHVRMRDAAKAKGRFGRFRSRYGSW